MHIKRCIRVWEDCVIHSNISICFAVSPDDPWAILKRCMEWYNISFQPRLVEDFQLTSLGGCCKLDYLSNQHWMLCAHILRKLQASASRNKADFYVGSPADSDVRILSFNCNLFVHGLYFNSFRDTHK